VLLFAHGIVGRADLPIPETLFGAAAAAVLVVSFVALALGWSKPRLKKLPEKPLFRIPRAVEVLLGVLGLAVFVIAVYAGIAGTSSQSQNFAPTAVYVLFWVGVPVTSLFFGNVSNVLQFDRRTLTTILLNSFLLAREAGITTPYVLRSAMNAACGPYIAAWNTSPPTTASVVSAKLRVSTSAMNTNAQTPTPDAPTR